MARFVEVPPARLDEEVLQALLEEFASRDGTDYGDRELSLEQKVLDLRRQLRQRGLLLLFDSESETWDLLEREHAESLLHL
jgi:uncharacterized protein YheU (UPF0270 family)